MNKGSLYLVPTPIGNLKDITLRAIEILQNVDLILCEDTRTSSVLLHHYNIKTPTKSYHKFNEKEMSPKIITTLENGQNIALISDAGTPLISDPGTILIHELKKASITPIPLPGASALTTFLCTIDNPTQNFEFVGFLPAKLKEREKIFEKANDRTIIFYESPNRIIKTLKDWCKQNPKSIVAIGRELTKIYEEIKQDKVENIIDFYTKNPPKGEIVAAFLNLQKKDNIYIDNYIKKLLSQGYGAKDISKILHTIFNINKKEIYQKTLNFQAE